MKFTSEWWTYLIVTVMAVLIWFWAAGDTLVQKNVYARVRFVVPDQTNWVVSPSDEAINISVQASNLSLQKLNDLVKNPLSITIPAAPGRQNINLVDHVRLLTDIQETGATVLAVEPRTVDVDVDQIERLTVRVKPVLPGVTTEGEVVVDPPEVRLSLPSQVRQSLPTGWAVEAFVDRSELDRLEPGIRHTLDVRLRLSQDLSAHPRVQVNPARVRLSFVIRSRIRETTLDSVRVHLSGPPEEGQLYHVEMEPRSLRNVVVSADADLIQRIIDTKNRGDRGEPDTRQDVRVVAIVHLSSDERNRGIDSKRVSYFIAYVPDGSGGVRGKEVSCRVGDSSEPPLIQLRITRIPLPNQLLPDS